MKSYYFILAAAAFCIITLIPSIAFGLQQKTKDIRIRDPFIYADRQSGKYYMYAQAANRSGSGFTGVEVYTGRDLVNWDKPQPVLILPEEAGVKMVWAPEMHKYKDKYYLFVTLTLKEKLPVKKPVNKKDWPGMYKRGTHIFFADSSLGPFKPFKKTPNMKNSSLTKYSSFTKYSSCTPEDWMALDGTLYVEDGKPYMVFCHEWVQTIDGTMDYVRLKDDLSDTVGEPELMFKASDAPGLSISPDKGFVTDGCFMYRSPKSGGLFMIWSTFIPGKGYCVLLTRAGSGRISGQWKEQKLIYTRNGGHGMIFKALDGRLIMALHQPNSGDKERLHLFTITDNGETLVVGNEIDLK